MREWTLISNHGLVLAAIARNPHKTAREIGEDVGITERTAHKIIVDLEEAGYITRSKIGVRNAYEIHPDTPLRNRLSDAMVGELLAVFGWQRKQRRKKTETSKSDSSGH